MPLDITKARGRIQGARTAYYRGPAAEFIQNLATDLEDALNLVDGATITSQRAQNEVARVQRELDAEKTAYRLLREQSVHTERAIALLREIKASPKGAQKKAADMLAEMGIVDAPVVPAKVVVA